MVGDQSALRVDARPDLLRDEAANGDFGYEQQNDQACDDAQGDFPAPASGRARHKCPLCVTALMFDNLD